MKKIFFPFRKNYNELKNYWWHRLFIIIFIFSVFLSGVMAWQSSNQLDVDSYESCLKIEMAIFDNSNSPNANLQYETGKKQCLDSFDQTKHPIFNLVYGVVVAIITFYVLQIIYYKIILYIIYGERSRK